MGCLASAQDQVSDTPKSNGQPNVADMALDNPQRARGSFYNDALYGASGKVSNHEKGSTSVYDKAVRQIVVGRLAYANEGNSSSSVQGAVKCLRVDKFAPGSQTSAAVSLESSAASIAAALAVFMLAL